MKRTFLAIALLLLSGSVFAQSVPQTMNFQGRLAKPDGTPVPDTAAQSLTFRLYKAASGGSPLWQQVGSVAVHNGTFSSALDFSKGFSGTNTFASVFAAAPYLEVQVGNDAPLTPRQTFASVAYAFNANTANTVPNGSIGLNQIAPGVLNFSNIGGQISGSQIASGGITSANLCSSIQQTLSKITLVSSGGGSLTLIGSAKVPSSPGGLAVSGNTACIIGQNVLQVFDVTSPASTVLTGFAPTATGPTTLAMSGNYAYVVSTSTGGGVTTNSLQIFDVSIPALPTLTGSIVTSSGPHNLAISGNYVYITTSDSSLQTYTLQVFDVSNPAKPTLKSTTNIPQLISGQYTSPGLVSVSGNYAYVNIVNVSNYNGQIYSSTLQVFDVSNPTAPTMQGSIGIPAYPNSASSIVASGTFAYVLSNGMLEVIDARFPTFPYLRGSVATSGYSMAVSGNYAYVTSSVSNPNPIYSLNAFDVSNPDNPVLANSATTGSNPNSVATSGSNVYTLATLGGIPALQIFSTTGNSQFKISGDLVVSGNGYFSGSVFSNGVALTSDARYKTNIATLNNALDDVLSLRGVSYDFDRGKWPAKNFPEGRQVGFIAQELEKVLPELVHTDGDGYKSVMYQNVAPVLVEAVKTLKRDNDDKQKQIDELRKQLAEVLARLAQIEATQKADKTTQK